MAIVIRKEKQHFSPKINAGLSVPLVGMTNNSNGNAAAIDQYDQKEWRYEQYYIRIELSSKPGKRWFVSWGEYVEDACETPDHPSHPVPRGGTHAYTNGAAALIATKAYESFPLTSVKKDDFYNDILSYLDQAPWREEESRYFPPRNQFK